jgi:hypothetical protein
LSGLFAVEGERRRPTLFPLLFDFLSKFKGLLKKHAIEAVLL